MTTNCSANWLKSDENEIFYWLHTPQQNIKNTAVIFIGPIGPEYMPCHRSIKLLADNLTQSGFYTIRYDPIAMGNSSGQLSDSNIWDKWIHTPKQFTDFLKTTFNINKVILIGLRSGCLVLSESLKEIPAHHAIFWHPISRGSAFIRGIQLLDSVLYESGQISTNSTLEGGGYPFYEELQNNIKPINLTTQDYTQLNSVLIINDQQSSHNLKLADNLTAANVNTDSVYLNGLDDMIKQVTLSKIPYSNLDFIQDWLDKLNLETIDNSNKQNLPGLKFTHPHFVETALRIPSKNDLFGILTTPTNNANDKIVLFVNTGAAHHAGPNRIHVDAARIMAKNGITTLRIDLSNLGDSATSYIQDPPTEYPENAPTDINTAIYYAETVLKKKEIVLCGISAGAHNIFHAALESSCKCLSKLILINPETFYWSPQKSNNPTTEVLQTYYRKQIFHYKKWGALMTNPTKLYNTSFFVIKFFLKKTQNYLFKLLTLFNFDLKNRLEIDLISLWDKGIFITLIYSENDPAYSTLMAQASRSIKIYSKKNLYSHYRITNADHTFSSIKSRYELTNVLTNYINRKFT